MNRQVDHVHTWIKGSGSWHCICTAILTVKALYSMRRESSNG
jgi:hypothetical protein